MNENLLRGVCVWPLSLSLPSRDPAYGPIGGKAHNVLFLRFALVVGYLDAGATGKIRPGFYA